jgi:hypothetical protein
LCPSRYLASKLGEDAEVLAVEVKAIAVAVKAIVIPEQKRIAKVRPVLVFPCLYV